MKSKLYAIVFASFLARIAAFLLLPKSESSLQIDEITYASLTDWVSKGLPADKHPYPTLYSQGRTLILPATILFRLGINALDSVRLVATLYGLLALLLIVKTIITLEKRASFKYSSKLKYQIAVLVFAYAFLPSHFVWSILGIRESPLEFWILLTFYIVFLTKHFNQGKLYLYLTVLPFSLMLIFTSRSQIGWVVSVSLLIYFTMRIRHNLSSTLIMLTLVGMLLGYVSTTAYSVRVIQKYSIVESDNYNDSKTAKKKLDTSNRCKKEGQLILVDKTRYICKNESQVRAFDSFKNPLTVLASQASDIPTQQIVNQIGASSAIKTIYCPVTNNFPLSKYLCLAWRAPYSTFTFMFRPLLGLDTTSTSSLFAGIENIFWVASCVFILASLTRNRRLHFFEEIAPSLVFFLIYIVAAGAYEGNMGTAFRHKSLILWVVLLLIASTIAATQQRKAEQQGVSGSSQE